MSVRLAITALGLVVAVGACAPAISTPDTPTPAPTGAPTPAPSPPLVVDWRGEFDIDLPNGWTLRACEGDAPLVCFADGDRHVGVVELLDWALPDDVAGDSLDQLIAYAAQFLDDLADDRAAGCPDLVFEAIAPVATTAGGAPAVRAGFRMVDVDGHVHEHHVLHWAVRNDTMYVVNAGAYGDDACVERMGEFLPADLEAALPFIERMVAQTPLPEPTHDA